MNMNDIKSKLPEFVRTPRFAKALSILAIIIIALLIFQAGVFVGYRKAAFSYRWGDNYYRTFGPAHERGRISGNTRGDFPVSSGASGTIIQVDLPVFVMIDSDKIERVVRVSNDTIIRRLRESLKPEDLKDNQYVVVIGSPNADSEIDARFIRLLPGSASTSPKFQ
jgi:hypothetical protein